MTPTTIRPHRTSTSQTGNHPRKHGAQSSGGLSGGGGGGGDAGLTGVGDSVHLTSAVHGYAQHGRFVVPSETSAIERVRQEGQVRHHDTMRLLHIVQPLHTHAHTHTGS